MDCGFYCEVNTSEYPVNKNPTTIKNNDTMVVFKRFSSFFLYKRYFIKDIANA
jgi:hypothetical protein